MSTAATEIASVFLTFIRGALMICADHSIIIAGPLGITLLRVLSLGRAFCLHSEGCIGARFQRRFGRTYIISGSLGYVWPGLRVLSIALLLVAPLSRSLGLRYFTFLVLSLLCHRILVVFVGRVRLQEPLIMQVPLTV